MRIGFYGGMANNMYVFAKELHDLGQDVVFIDDVSDTYPMSQAVWQDIEAVVDYDLLNKQTFTKDYWKEFEKKNNWSPPSWFVRIDESKIRCNDVSKIKFRGKLQELYFKNYYLTGQRKAVLSTMQECDILMVCGYEGELLASISGIPYVIWPHGGDIRFAAGITKIPFYPIKNFLSNIMMRFFLKKSFKYASAVGSHDPKGVGGDLGSTDKVLYGKKLRHLPIPIRCAPKLNKEQKFGLREELSKKFSLDFPKDDKLFLFVPSRIDFYWKGHETILQSLRDEHSLFILFCGWGKDFDRAREYVRKNNLETKVAFLDKVLTKPLLFKFFQACDLVIDQINFGTYGTSMVEAMACGAPVMIYINNDVFQAKGWSPPPIINVNSKADIVSAFNEIVSGKINLYQKAGEAFNWVSSVHSSKNAYKCLLRSIGKQV